LRSQIRSAVLTALNIATATFEEKMVVFTKLFFLVFTPTFGSPTMALFTGVVQRGPSEGGP
jgi:hypothetical protein